jgi:beta-lactamase class D
MNKKGKFILVRKRLYLLLLLFLIVGKANSVDTSKCKIIPLNSIDYVEIKGYSEYFKENDVDGSVFIYDVKNNKYIGYNFEQFNDSYIPASTFKICNSLIALETGVAKDENFLLKWDGIKRNISSWNKDTNMKTAMKNSTVWYYQEIARRIGEKRMKNWLIKLGYGNSDISGGIDKFWLDGGLRISPALQIDFLLRFYKNELPLTQRTMDIVKNMIIIEKKNDYVFRAKTGWGMRWSKQSGFDVGWYVGFVENKDNTYIFSTCIQQKDSGKNPKFHESRISITRRVFESLGIIKN